MTELNNTLKNCVGDDQFELEKAGIGMRIAAFIIDHIFIVMILVCPFMMYLFRTIQDHPSRGWCMFTAVMLVAFLAYCIKDVCNGASMGKRALGLVVRNRADTSEVPAVSKLILRNILTFMWPVEFLVLVCSAKKIKLGDQMVGTDVYRSHKKPQIAIIVITVVLVVVIFIGSFVLGISSIIKNDSSYRTAVSYIETNSEVMDYVGEIEGYGYLPSGEVSYSGNYGQAQYTIKVIGSKNTAFIHLQMEKMPENDWEITYFKMSEGERNFDEQKKFY